MSWRYNQFLGGNEYIGYVMDGDRIVCSREHVGIDVKNPGPEVERTQRELRSIVNLRAAAERD